MIHWKEIKSLGFTPTGGGGPTNTIHIKSYSKRINNDKYNLHVLFGTSDFNMGMLKRYNNYYINYDNTSDIEPYDYVGNADEGEELFKGDISKEVIEKFINSNEI